MKTFISSIFIAFVLIIGVECLSYQNDISFFVYPPSGGKVSVPCEESFVSAGCDPTGPWAMIVHGWLESTNHTTWIPNLVKNLTKYRGGCIIAIDYFNYSKGAYGALVSNFDGISFQLYRKISLLVKQGFSLENGFLFGFSFGAHLVYNAGTKLGGKIPRIDVCDPAGPGFDGTVLWKDPKTAGKNVQCINTSSDKGTHTRKCHQNWLMGKCGFLQDAAGSFPMGHHGLCPHIYNSAFENNFFAEPNPLNCKVEIGVVSTNYPDKLRMGYTDERMSDVRGSLFSRTYKTYNYAAPA